MPSVKSQCKVASSQPPPIMWSQRALPSTDIIVKGEGIFLDCSQNKPTPLALCTVSVTNGRLGAVTGSGSSGVHTRSYLQTKIGAKMIKGNKDQQQQQQLGISGKSLGENQNSSQVDDGVKGQQPGSSASCCTSSWTWDSGCDSVLLDPFVEKKDQELFQQCREHLDAINQSTQVQQVINDEMRSQAELDQIVYDSLKAKTQRLAKQTGLGDADWDQSWINTAFVDLRKCVKEQAHAHSAYSQTLLNQSTAIQQSLDSHKNLMEKTKRAQSTPDVDGNWKGSNTGMSFVQATCEFERVHKPRLKLISELDFLNTQVKSLDQQLRDIESMLSSIKESEETGQAQWRFQHKLEEARTRHDFLRSRRAQLQGELKAVGAELKEFHQRHRDKMVLVVNVFNQHRDRCDSTLRKSISLLRAASQSDRDVLKTLDAQKKNPAGEHIPPSSADNLIQQTRSNNRSGNVKNGEPGKGGTSSNGCGEEGVLSLQQTQDKNPLKTRKVCFGETQFGDSEFRLGGPRAETDSTSNHSNVEDESDTESVSLGGSRSKMEWKIKTEAGVKVNKACKNKVSSPQRSNTSDNKPSYFTFLPLQDDQSPTKSVQTDTDQSIYNKTTSGGKPVSKSSSRHKTRLAFGEMAIKGTKLFESTIKTSGPTNVERSEENDDVIKFSSKSKNDRGSLDRLESKTNSVTYRDRKEHSEESCKSEANSRTKTTRPSTTPVSGTKSKESKTALHDNLQTNLTVTAAHPRARSMGDAIILSSESRSKQSPVRTLAQGLPVSPTPNRTDNSAGGKARHDVDSDEKASASDSELSDVESSRRVSRTAQGAEKSRCKGAGCRQAKGEESPDERTRAKSSNLVSGKPPPSHTKQTAHMSRSRETSASSDIGRRRVAFSDLEANSSQPSETKSRGSSASGSQTRTIGQDRGILKKPSNSNSTVKTVVLNEDKAAKSRIRLDYRSQGGDIDGVSASPSDTTQSKARHGSQDETAQGDSSQKPSDEMRTRPQGAFIPEESESSQPHSSASSSEISSADEKGRDGKDDPWFVEKMNQLERENRQLHNFMREQKRMCEEEDRMNRLISKYANNRRGIGGLSMNYNNSETTVLPSGEVFKDSLPRAGNDTVVERGREDRLEFDVDNNRQDDDSCRDGGTPLVDGTRQLKVCAVRPISTDASDFNQNENPGEQIVASTDQCYEQSPQNVDKRHSKPALDRLKEFEVTAGQFLERSFEGESKECISLSEETQEEERKSSCRHAQQKEMPISRRSNSGWSVQKYSDSQTDLNNNLSSVCDNVAVVVLNDQPTVQSRQPSVVFGDSRRKSSPQNYAQYKNLESELVPVNTELTERKTVLERHQDQSSEQRPEHYRNYRPSSSVRDRCNPTSSTICPHCNDTVATPAKDANRLYLSRSHETDTQDKPWQHDTGFECYTAEEKVALPDSRLLCQDLDNDKLQQRTTERPGRPLKSCLKRKPCEKVSYQTELYASTETTESCGPCMGSDKSINVIGREENTGRHPYTEQFFSSRTHQFQQRHMLHGYPPDSSYCLAKTGASNKYQKRVQFREPIQCSYTQYDCAADRSHATEAIRGITIRQRGDCDLNLSNNSSSTDCPYFSNNHIMNCLMKPNWVLLSQPLSGCILVSLPKQSGFWDFFRSRARELSSFMDSRHRQSKDIRVLRTSGINQDCQTTPYLCQLKVQKDALLAIFILQHK